jgi:hypothetical protein
VLRRMLLLRSTKDFRHTPLLAAAGREQGEVTCDHSVSANQLAYVCSDACVVLPICDH